MRNFRNLEIWNKAISLSKNIYVLTNQFPDKERFGLISQLQRAAVSIASNIAEGSSRRSETDFARFLEISQGSAFEIETQLTIAKEIGYIKEDQFVDMITELNIIQKQINQLITKIRQ
jgi:four helix bundle protein